MAQIKTKIDIEQEFEFDQINKSRDAKQSESNDEYAITESQYSSKSIRAYDDKGGIEDFEGQRGQNHIMIDGDLSQDELGTEESFSDIDETMDRYKKRYELKKAGIDIKDSREATRKPKEAKKKAIKKASFRETPIDIKKQSSETMNEYELIRNDIIHNEKDDQNINISNLLRKNKEKQLAIEEILKTHESEQREKAPENVFKSQSCKLGDDTDRTDKNTMDLSKIDRYLSKESKQKGSYLPSSQNTQRQSSRDQESDSGRKHRIKNTAAQDNSCLVNFKDPTLHSVTSREQEAGHGRETKGRESVYESINHDVKDPYDDADNSSYLKHLKRSQEYKNQNRTSFDSSAPASVNASMQERNSERCKSPVLNGNYKKVTQNCYQSHIILQQKQQQPPMYEGENKASQRSIGISYVDSSAERTQRSKMTGYKQNQASRYQTSYEASNDGQDEHYGAADDRGDTDHRLYQIDDDGRREESVRSSFNLEAVDTQGKLRTQLTDLDLLHEQDLMLASRSKGSSVPFTGGPTQRTNMRELCESDIQLYQQSLEQAGTIRSLQGTSGKQEILAACASSESDEVGQNPHDEVRSKTQLSKVPTDVAELNEQPISLNPRTPHLDSKSTKSANQQKQKPLKGRQQSQQEKSVFNKYGAQRQYKSMRNCREMNGFEVQQSASFSEENENPYNLPPSTIQEVSDTMQEETDYHKSSVVHGNYSKQDVDTGRETLKQYIGSSPQHLPYYSSG